MNWLSFLLDLTLVGLLSTGIFYAIRLSQQLAAMRASRNEMERFVVDFSTTVTRAENGIKGLKATARSSGDDLEKLIDSAKHMRDELHFLVESADTIADRLSNTAATAATATRQGTAPKQAAKAPTPKAAPKTAAKTAQKPAARKSHAEALAALSASGDKLVSSAAEKELLRALKKIG